jgi:hypothetical protein
MLTRTEILNHIARQDPSRQAAREKRIRQAREQREADAACDPATWQSPVQLRKASKRTSPRN